MNRLFALPTLLLMTSIALVACSKGSQPTTNATSASSSVRAPSNLDTAVTSAAAVSTASSSAADSAASSSEAPLQLSETGATEVVDTPPAGTQGLALKMTQGPSAPANSQWKEGINYRLLVPTQPTSALPGQIEVTEAFWYGCSHCYALDPLLENWRKRGKPDYVSFVRIPVMWGAVQRIHARVFYTAELLGKLDELHSQIFAEIHDKHDPLATDEQIAAFFTSRGVSKADFDKAFASSAIDASLKRAETLGLRYRIESVPTVIVNGKYVTDVGMAGGQQQLISLVAELAAREKGT